MNFSFRNGAFKMSATISWTFIYVVFLIWTSGFQIKSQVTRHGTCGEASSAGERNCTKQIAALLLENSGFEKTF